MADEIERTDLARQAFTAVTAPTRDRLSPGGQRLVDALVERYTDDEGKADRDGEG